MPTFDRKIALWDALAKLGLWVIQRSPRRVVVVLFIAAAILLFAPPSRLRLVGLDGVAVLHRNVVGVTFLISLILTLTYTCTWTFDKARAILDLRRSRQAMHELTNPEKKLLQRFYVRHTKTQRLSPASGVVRGLEMAGILFRASDLGNMKRLSEPVFAYNLHHWVWKLISQHPELISTPDGWYDPDHPD